MKSRTYTKFAGAKFFSGYAWGTQSNGLMENRRRDDALDRRRALMDGWTDFLTGADSNVIPISRRVAG
jgi:hypothetical protein